MDESQDKRIMSLVHACAEMDPAARSDYLRAHCEGDPQLRSQVESLLAENGLKTGVHPSTQRRADALPEHYRLIELIGAGGMAEVFLAEDTRLHRKVAIKFLNDVLVEDPERMRRFMQEARSASALNHPNIITIHDIGESDGVQFIVSEYVEGETLATRMTRGRLAIPEAIDIAIRIASALDSSHRAGIVHRDLKPENIMLRTDGGLKVVDFGLAKGSGIFEQQGATLEIVTTSPGLILGTPRYMSPEQARGLPLDGRSDVFSLGIILFEMVTGRTPFPGGTIADTLAAILRHEPRPITEFVKDPPQKLVQIIEKALRKDPEARYRSMASLLADLEDLRLDLTLPHRAVQPPVSPTPGLGRIGLATGVVGALVLMTAGWWYFSGPRSSTVTTGAMRNVPITSWPSVSADAASAASFSPDAKMVAFGSTRSGSSEIWSKPVAGGEAIQVTRDGFYNQYPVWSPDGLEIIFFSSRGSTRGLWKVSFSGGQETQVASGFAGIARPLRWTSNGVYAMDANEVILVDPNSGERKPLTNFAAGASRPTGFAVSFDGTKLALTVKDGDAWKLNCGGFADVPLKTVATAKEQIDSIAFHPNGSSIFYSTAVDGIRQIFETTASGADPVQVSSGGSDLSLHDVSFDGSKILYGSINETSDLWSLGAADGTQTVVANDVSEEYWPDFSPDGKSIVYEAAVQADRPYHGSILVRQLDAKASPAVVAADGFAPSWSPDGKWIAYFRRTETGVSVWKVRPSGTDAVKIADGEIAPPGYRTTPYLKLGMRHLSWGPDGSVLLYSAKNGGISDIWKTASESAGNASLLKNSDPSVRICCAAWRRDAQRIVVEADPTSADAKTWKVLAVNADGTDVREVYRSDASFRLLGYDDGGNVLISQKVESAASTAAPPATNVIRISPDGKTSIVNTLRSAYSDNINLSPDGRTMFFATREKDTSEIWTVASSGGEPRRLYLENDPKMLFSGIAISPDSRTLVFGKQTRTNILAMLTK